jgi:hypothetical protein
MSTNQPRSPSKTKTHEERDKAVWRITKKIPLVNIVHGVGRAIAYGCKGDTGEMARSLGHAGGGVASIAAMVGAVAAAPVLFVSAPVVLGVGVVGSVVGGGAAQQIIGGGTELIIAHVQDKGNLSIRMSWKTNRFQCLKKHFFFSKRFP